MHGDECSCRTCQTGTPAERKAREVATLERWHRRTSPEVPHGQEEKGRRPVLTLTLVCEGPCNPQIDLVDQAIARFQQTTRNYGIEDAREMAAPAVAAAYQGYGIRHTEHLVEKRPNFARCVKCGTTRRHSSGQGTWDE
jgi:hypothetical protein